MYFSTLRFLRSVRLALEPLATLLKHVRKPQSLLTRSTLLIAGLIITGQLITAVLFVFLVQRPRLQVMVELADGHLHTVRVAMALLPPEKRGQYLSQAGHDFGVHLQEQPPTLDPSAPEPPFVIRKFMEAFAKKLQPHEQIRYQSAPDQAIWVQIVIDQQAYWVKFSATPFSTDIGDHWLGLLLLIVMLAFLGGFIIHRSLNRPLQRLAAAVSRIGKGERTEAIKEEGPKEIVTFIHALNRMNADLKQMEADRTLMLAGISHDLRTPITRIQLALEMIGGDFDKDLKNRIVANLAEIEGGLRQCLDFARDSADEPCQIADLNDLARLCAASYKTNGYHISLDLCEEAEAEIRPFGIERLLKNLLDNAIKYANNGITIATRHDNGQLHLSVLDRGEGLSESDIEKLRRPFARADTARGSVGYGLGLAIVDNIVQAHQAKIDFLAREGGGLEVRVSFKPFEETLE